MGFQEITVLNGQRQFVCYVHPAFARKLLKDHAAVVYSRSPFIIQVMSMAVLANKRK